ncbi:MAG: V-type ATP synthase subunit E [bacterium]
MQNIIEKILDVAKTEAKEITQRYEKEIEKIRKEYEEKIIAEEKRLRDEVEKRKQEEIMRAIAQERLFYNKKLTAEMQKHIDDVLHTAIKELPGHRDYFKFLTGLIKNSGVNQGDLYLSPDDFKKYRSQLEKFCTQEGLNLEIKTDNNMLGGIILKREKTTFLGSLDVIVELMKDELKIAIAKTLSFV